MRFLISFSVFENSMMAFNRCLSYKNIISERPYKTELDKELTLWPQNSDIEFQNVSVKYRKDLNNSLSDITFKLNSNEKIGVCGRTGSGKSTLTLTLIRILELEKGKIIIDNVDISKIGLEKLRNSISYISQDVFIFEGTIKENVDPYNIHDNNEIEELLTKFNQFQNNNRFNLNFKISENGNNLSYGEKQIISIIRALIKKSKITILDEATSNIDFDIEKKYLI
jgi:ABC-type multidrug transport system fused ATPase/permease subunit